MQSISGWGIWHNEYMFIFWMKFCVLYIACPLDDMKRKQKRAQQIKISFYLLIFKSTKVTNRSILINKKLAAE